MRRGVSRDLAGHWAPTFSTASATRVRLAAPLAQSRHWTCARTL